MELIKMSYIWLIIIITDVLPSIVSKVRLQILLKCSGKGDSIRVSRVPEV